MMGDGATATSYLGAARKQKSFTEMNGPPSCLTTDRHRKSVVRAEEGVGLKSVQTEAGVLLDSPAWALNKT